MENNENMIEWLTNSKTATVTFTNQKHINKIKSIYAERKDEFKYFVENADGSICAKIPLKWIKVSPGSKPGTRAKREYTEEEKETLRKRLVEARAKKLQK
jgi:hypothetical protein